MALLHENFLSGTITDSPLTSVATTINSAGFGVLQFPTITTDTMYLVLDPEGTAGAPEIVTVTAHSSLATVVTVTRGSEGTVAREHASGTVWRHSYVASEIDNVGTDNLAADAVTGAKIADDAIDSEHYVDGSIDTVHIADGQVTAAKIDNDLVANSWTSFTPTWTNLTVGDGTHSNCAYRRVPGGMWVKGQFTWGSTTSGTASGFKFDVPGGVTGLLAAEGSSRYRDDGGSPGFHAGTCYLDGSNDIQFLTADQGFADSAAPFTWTQNDEIHWLIFIPVT